MTLRHLCFVSVITIMGSNPVLMGHDVSTMNVYPHSHGDRVQDINLPTPNPTGVTLGPDGLLYYTDGNLDRVIGIDPATHDVTLSINHPDTYPSSITYLEGTLWSVGYHSRSLYAHSAEDGKALGVYPLPQGVQPCGVTHGKGVLYVSDMLDWRILVVDPHTGTVLEQLIAPERGIRGLAWDGHTLWCTSESQRYLILMDVERQDWVCRVYPDLPEGHMGGLDFYQGRLYITHGEGVQRHISIMEPPVNGSAARTRLTKSNMVVTRMDSLKNHTGLPCPATTACIIKPTTNAMQDVLGFDTIPAFTDITTDKEGNQYACVPIPELQPNEHFSLYSRVAYDQFETWQVFYPHQVTPLSTVPEDIAQLYLRDDRLLQLNHALVQFHARQAARQETNAFWLARQIVYYLPEVMGDYGDSLSSRDKLVLRQN